MGVVDGLIDLVSDIISWIVENLWWIILVIIIIICIFFPYLIPVIWAWVVTNVGALLTFIAGLGIEGAIAAALFLLVLFDPEGAGQLIGGIAGDVIGGIGGVVTDLAHLLLTTPGGWLICGVGAYFLFKGDGGNGRARSADNVVEKRGSGRSTSSSNRVTENWRTAKSDTRRGGESSSTRAPILANRSRALRGPRFGSSA